MTGQRYGGHAHGIYPAPWRPQSPPQYSLAHPPGRRCGFTQERNWISTSFERADTSNFKLTGYTWSPQPVCRKFLPNGAPKRNKGPNVEELA
eukprot:703782-Pyramimonas_sp.AAC.1